MAEFETDSEHIVLHFPDTTLKPVDIKGSDRAGWDRYIRVLDRNFARDGQLPSWGRQKPIRVPSDSDLVVEDLGNEPGSVEADKDLIRFLKRYNSNPE